jgi:hypothetical protein
MSGLRDFSDEQLLAECRVETFRGPGPGGQKRNKTSSGVRIAHQPSGLNAIATESRSQQTNRSVALSRLRIRLAVQIREPWGGKSVNLRISRRSADYPAAVGLLLDALADSDWSVSVAAEKLGTTTGQIAKFLHADEDVLTEANLQRGRRGLKKLG